MTALKLKIVRQFIKEKTILFIKSLHKQTKHTETNVNLKIYTSRQNDFLMTTNLQFRHDCNSFQPAIKNDMLKNKSMFRVIKEKS